MKISCTVYFHVSKAADTLNTSWHINPQLPAGDEIVIAADCFDLDLF